MTAVEIVPANSAALAPLDPASREVAVTAYLAHARDQLAHAVEMSGPAAVAALKAEIATAAEATKQLGLSKEIQSDAQEMVRRAEYALGKAIRAGQERGEVRTVGDGGPRSDYIRNGQPVHVTAPAVQYLNKMSPADFLPSNQERVDIYEMVDTATDVEFETALSDARTEGNMSRANVVRKIKGVKSEGTTAVEKLTRIRDMAPRGYTSGQIADELGCTESYVRDRAREHGITITADEVLRRTHRVKVDHNHTVSHLVMTLEVVTDGLERVDLDALDEAQIRDWADSLTTTTRTLNRFVKQMKEKAQ